jgi:hypothetical protein
LLHPSAWLDGKASLSEVEVLNHFIDARDQHLLTEEEFRTQEHQVRKALKAVTGLIRHLETTPDPPSPTKKPPHRNTEPTRT